MTSSANMRQYSWHPWGVWLRGIAQNFMTFDMHWTCLGNSCQPSTSQPRGSRGWMAVHGCLEEHEASLRCEAGGSGLKHSWICGSRSCTALYRSSLDLHSSLDLVWLVWRGCHTCGGVAGGIVSWGYAEQVACGDGTSRSKPSG